MPIGVGYCYLAASAVEAACPREVKIGSSTKPPRQRERELRGQGRERYRIVACFACGSDGSDIERQAHADLSVYRLPTGEWFSYEPEVRAYFESRFPYVALPPSAHALPVPKRDRTIRRHENPGAIAAKTGWSRDPEGRLAKLLLYLAALEKAGSDRMLLQTSAWARFGITEIALEAMIEALLPGFFSRQPRRRGQCLNRLYYMFNEKDGTTGRNVKRLSAEHPLRSKVLGPYLAVAERLYRRGRSISAEEVIKDMTA